MAEYPPESYAQLVRLRDDVDREHSEALLAIAGTVDGNPNAWHDNFSYDDAIRREQELRRRLSMLNAMIEHAVVVDKSGPHSQVGVGSYVEVVATDGDTIFMIGGEFNVERHTAEGFRVLSTKSPLGQALLGHVVGDVVRYRLPNGGEREVAVKNVW